MKKNTKSTYILVTLLIILLLILINSNTIINNIIDYSILFLTKLFPVSFIFFILSTLLIKYGLLDFIYKIFNFNSSKLYIFIISLISGFPSGSKYTKDLLESGYITVKDSNHIIMFSHFPNPLFVLGSVNLLLKDYTLSLKILISIIISNFIIFLVNIKSTSIFPNNVNRSSFSTNLTNSIIDSFHTMIIIYGISLFFYLISFIITKYIFINTNIFILVNGIFDLTNGVFSTSLINDNIIRSYYILVFICFGSLSIHMQVNSFLENTNISYKYFVFGRIISTILAIIIFSFLI